MNGLILKLLSDANGNPGRWFWPCFEPLRTHLDQFYWVFTYQPWMCAPAAVLDAVINDDAPNIDPVPPGGVQLWKPGTISRWAGTFLEEFIELWAVPPDADAHETANQFGQREADGRQIIDERAQIWLVYTDSQCWEIYARDADILDRIRKHTHELPLIRSFESNTQHRYDCGNKAGVGLR